MGKLEDLIGQKKQIEEQIEKEKERIREEKIEKSKQFRDSLTQEQKEIILSLFNHSRTSCSDEHPCNGWDSYEGYARCKKCALIEYFNDEIWDAEVCFDVDFYKI